MNNSILSILISLKNSAKAKKSFVKINVSKKSFPLVNILYRKGLIQSIRNVAPSNKNCTHFSLVLYLRYYYNDSLLENLKIISSSTKVKRLQLNDITRLSEVNNLLFFSTPFGLKTLSECKKFKTGGIVLFKC